MSLFALMRGGLVAVLLLLPLAPANAANRLAGHPSPYLALHADDPVDWRPWEADVFAAARSDNRLVYVSLGYFSCHWCHVMQRESYQDQQAAGLLNRNYIAVKVDRELDPDLDRRLFDFVEKVRGVAGWPLNVFLTPDGYPITGFTYLPRDDFVRVLQELDVAWRQNHAKLSGAAREFFETRMRELDNEAFDAPRIPAQNLVDAFVSQSMLAADEMLGGFGNTSKFPNVPQLDALIDIVARDPGLDADVTEFAVLTLDAMASRNLMDHANDGFFRYTTDPDWETPHFEKMLYDNAQLASLYLKAHGLWPERGYADIAFRTLEFVELNLKHPQGGYMSSLSAVDRDNREGSAYFWSLEQLAAYLDQAEVEYLDNLWQLRSKTSEFMLEPLLGIGSRGDPERNRIIRAKLRARGNAAMPADDKRLASWNAMMLEALTAAAALDGRYRQRARVQYLDMRQFFYRDGGALVRLAGNADVAEAVLEDYAQVALAFLNYGRRFDDAQAVAAATRLAQRAQSLFIREDRWQQKTNTLIPLAQGKWIIPDLVFFSPMTQWMKVALGATGIDAEVRATAMKMLRRASRDMLDGPYFYGSFIMLRVEHGG